MYSLLQLEYPCCFPLPFSIQEQHIERLTSSVGVSAHIQEPCHDNVVYFMLKARNPAAALLLLESPPLPPRVGYNLHWYYTVYDSLYYQTRLSQDVDTGCPNLAIVKFWTSNFSSGTKFIYSDFNYKHSYHFYLGIPRISWHFPCIIVRNPRYSFVKGMYKLNKA